MRRRAASVVHALADGVTARDGRRADRRRARRGRHGAEAGREVAVGVRRRRAGARRDDLEGRDLQEEEHRPGHAGDRQARAAAGRGGRRREQAVLRRPRPDRGQELRPQVRRVRDGVGGRDARALRAPRAGQGRRRRRGRERLASARHRQPTPGRSPIRTASSASPRGPFNQRSWPGRRPSKAACRIGSREVASPGILAMAATMSRSPATRPSSTPRGTPSARSPTRPDDELGSEPGGPPARRRATAWGCASRCHAVRARRPGRRVRLSVTRAAGGLKHGLGLLLVRERLDEVLGRGDPRGRTVVVVAARRSSSWSSSASARRR